MNKIKNIIFDLGNVLLDIDPNKTNMAFEQLGIKNFKSKFSLIKMDDLFEELETGKVTEDYFYNAIKEISKKQISTTQIKNAWNALLLSYRKQSLQFLETLSAQYKLYLLSNTNSIHLAAFYKIFNKEIGTKKFDDYFTKAYYSNNIGLRKPNIDAYHFVLSDAKIIASQTLFIDDLKINIDAAKSIGINTHLLLPQQNIETVIPKLLF